MHCATLSIGSNLGDKAAYLRFAALSLRAAPAVSAVRASSLWRTAPWGGVAQNPFYNAALQIETTLTPMELLALCQEIERQAGRSREIHWGDRTLDIDILFYDQEAIATEALTVPHPYLKQRRFVLAPLAELLPEAEPWLAECPDSTQVERIASAAEWLEG